jgi:hypothetical protein
MKMENGTCSNYSRNGGGEMKENDEEVNSAVIYCKRFCKCHNVPSAQQ